FAGGQTSGFEWRQVDALHRAAGRIDGTDPSVERREPQTPGRVGERRRDLVEHRAARGQVVVGDLGEPWRAGLRDYKDVPCRGTHHGAVQVVELEVAAGGEVVEGAGARLARRQREGRVDLEAARIHEHQV